jgi:hypothetical protein
MEHAQKVAQRKKVITYCSEFVCRVFMSVGGLPHALLLMTTYVRGHQLPTVPSRQNDGPLRQLDHFSDDSFHRVSGEIRVQRPEMNL